MKISIISLLLSINLSIENAILYDINLDEQASAIAELYNNQINPDFRLITTKYSNIEISDSYDDISESEKINLFITEQLIPSNPDLKYILILGDEISFPPIYRDCGLGETCPSDDLYAQIDQNPTIDVSFGRIPSSNVTEVTNFVNKLSNFLLTK